MQRHAEILIEKNDAVKNGIFALTAHNWQK